jgi:uncharacterized RDD family membrane protein YckC
VEHLAPARQGFRGRPAAGRVQPEELGWRGRRLGAFAVDSLLGVVAAFFVYPLFTVFGFSDDLVTGLWWFFGVPIAFALVTVPFMLRTGTRHGQTLGKQLLGLRVLDDSHTELTPGRAVARELLVKGPFWTGSVALFFIPALINGVWSMFDVERRGLQDRATGTRVVRAASRQG